MWNVGCGMLDVKCENVECEMLDVEWPCGLRIVLPQIADEHRSHADCLSKHRSRRQCGKRVL